MERALRGPISLAFSTAKQLLHAVFGWGAGSVEKHICYRGQLDSIVNAAPDLPVRFFRWLRQPFGRVDSIGSI